MNKLLIGVVLSSAFWNFFGEPLFRYSDPIGYCYRPQNGYTSISPSMKSSCRTRKTAPYVTYVHPLLDFLPPRVPNKLDFPSPVVPFPDPESLVFNLE